MLNQVSKTTSEDILRLLRTWHLKMYRAAARDVLRTSHYIAQYALMSVLSSFK